MNHFLFLNIQLLLLVSFSLSIKEHNLARSLHITISLLSFLPDFLKSSVVSARQFIKHFRFHSPPPFLMILAFPNAGDSVTPSTPPTKEEGLKDGSVIPSIPPTMKEDLKVGSVTPSTPSTMEGDPKDGSVVPSIPPTITLPTDTKKNISFSVSKKPLRGVIVDVRSVTEAVLAECAGAKAVNVTDNTGTTMADTKLIKDIKKTIKKIPVMVKIRVGHSAEARFLEANKLVDFIDESEYLVPADGENNINKRKFKVPFVCGCQNLGEALNRMEEGAALIRIDGFSSIQDTAKNVRGVMRKLRELKSLQGNEVYLFANEVCASYDLVAKIKEFDEFPLPLLAGGPIATPADAVWMMDLGCDGVFVGSDVFDLTADKATDRSKRLRDIVDAVADFDNTNSDDSVISSMPSTMEEDPKDDSVVPSSPPTKEDPKDEGVIEKTADLTIDDTKKETPDNPTNEDSVPPFIPQKDTQPIITLPTDTQKNISFSASKKRLRGVIVDVRSVNEAKMAEYAGVKAVNVIDIETMPDLKLIRDIKKALKKIPVMVKIRVGHFAEARILQATKLVDFIDESEYLVPADRENNIDKREFSVPFVCGCQNLGEALNRIEEGAALIRVDGFSNAEDLAKIVGGVMDKLGELKTLHNDQVFAFARNLSASYPLVAKIKELGEFPVPFFAGGTITEPEVAVTMMHLGCDGVFVKSDVFDVPDNANDRSKRLRDIVDAVAEFNNTNAMYKFMLG